MDKIIHGYNSEVFKIKSVFKKEEPVSLLVNLLDNSTTEVTFDCTKFSGILMSHSVDLAIKSEERSIKIWDINDILYEVNVEEARDISDALSLHYSNRILARQEAITEAGKL